MWYFIYWAVGLFILLSLLHPLGLVVMAVLGAVYIKYMDKDENADKVKLFLKRHRMPPYHKDDVDNEVK